MSNDHNADVGYLEPEIYTFSTLSKNFKQEIVAKNVCNKQRFVFSPISTSTRKVRDDNLNRYRLREARVWQ